MKAILKYPGAKNRIADWICSYIPSHKLAFTSMKMQPKVVNK